MITTLHNQIKRFRYRSIRENKEIMKNFFGFIYASHSSADHDNYIKQSDGIVLFCNYP